MLPPLALLKAESSWPAEPAAERRRLWEAVSRIERRLQEALSSSIDRGGVAVGGGAERINLAEVSHGATGAGAAHMWRAFRTTNLEARLRQCFDHADILKRDNRQTRRKRPLERPRQ